MSDHPLVRHRVTGYRNPEGGDRPPTEEQLAMLRERLPIGALTHHRPGPGFTYVVERRDADVSPAEFERQERHLAQCRDCFPVTELVDRKVTS